MLIVKGQQQHVGLLSNCFLIHNIGIKALLRQSLNQVTPHERFVIEVLSQGHLFLTQGELVCSGNLILMRFEIQCLVALF